MEQKFISTKAIVLILVFVIVSFSLLAQSPVKKFIDTANMDLSIHPGNDFHTYANGNWIRNNPVPADQTSWGSHEQLRNSNLKAVKTILEKCSADITALPGSDIRRLGDLYYSGIDTTLIEKRGAAPIIPYLNRAARINDIKKLISELNTLYIRGLSSHFFFINIAIDRFNPNQRIARFGQWGTTIDAQDYFDKNEERNLVIEKSLKKYIGSLFRLAGVSEKTANQNAISVFDLEKKIANAQIRRMGSGNTPTKFHVNDLRKTYPQFNWQQTLTQLKIRGEDSIEISNPSFFKSVDSLLAVVPLQEWKIYLQWNILRRAAGYLSKNFIDAEFTFMQLFNGQRFQAPRWRSVTIFIESYFADLLGQLYVKEYFDQAAKKTAIELFDNLRIAFSNRIQKLDWMSQAPKEKALLKLHAITGKIGFPEQWNKTDYNIVHINRQNYFENMSTILSWSYETRLSQLGKPVKPLNKERWTIKVTEIDAYYSAMRNEIGVPAGRLQFPFFDKNADDAVNYGGIGAIIGHEMSHGFDENGSKYDADGALRNWWTEEDRIKFLSKTKELLNQYNNYTVQDTIYVNGKLTLNENIADLCGLSIAYEAFRMTNQGQSNDLIDGFTPDQRFFLSWAQIRRSTILPQEEVQRIKTDSHSPQQYRTIGPLVNMDAWYKAFNIQPEHKLYKKQEDRIHIW